jgi:hypothetical protein
MHATFFFCLLENPESRGREGCLFFQFCIKFACAGSPIHSHIWKGGEYKSGDFNKYCKDNGIVQQFTVPHTPQQNRVAERKNRTLVECARSMMKGKNLSNAFWVEAINTALYLKNRSPTRCLDNVTPFEALYGSKPVVHNLKVFGCKDFSHIPKDNRRKLDAKAIKCIFIVYCSEFKAYKLFDLATHKVFASRDVLFHEQEA